MTKIDNKLTNKQLMFCQEYLTDMNATQAAIRAGYSEHTAQEQGSRLLSNAMVQGKLTELIGARSKRLKIDADTILSELLKLALTDIGKAFNDDGSLKPIKDIPEDVRRAISGVEIVEEFEGRGSDRVHAGWNKKVKFWDKTKALELLGRHLKLFTDKVEHTGFKLSIMKTDGSEYLIAQKDSSDED